MRISDWSSDVCSSDLELFPEGAGRPTEQRIDRYTEGLHIYRNTFKNNGNQLPLPTLKSITSSDVAKLLPVLIGLKNQAGCLLPQNLLTCPAPLLNVAPLAAGQIRGAHILWDGLLDVNDPACPYPKNSEERRG